jgi:serine/threonine-protein kinase
MDRLGGGASASVWRARDLATGEQVALKLIHPHFRLDGAALKLIQREAEALTRLRHPAIAEPYVALEYIEGSTLQEELTERWANQDFLPWRVLMSLFEQLTSGIEHAHSKGVIHRDLKPANLMFVREGSRARVKILDFGVAKLMDESPDRQTTQGRIRGSVAYMSPEQILGNPADGRADVFGLGTILFECVTLHRAWVWESDSGPCANFGSKVGSGECNSLLEVIERISSAPRPRTSDFRQGLGALDGVIAKAMTADRQQRFSGPLALWKAMVGVAAELGATGEVVEPEELGIEDLRTRAVSRSALDRAQTPLRPPTPAASPPPEPAPERLAAPGPEPKAPVAGSRPPWTGRALWIGVGLALGYLLGRLFPGP